MHFLRNPLTYITCIALLSPSVLSAQQQATEEKPQETEIIIIEQRVDHQGNKTVNKKVLKGNFTDEEIDRLVESESNDIEPLHKEHKANANRGYLGVMIEGAEDTQGVRVTEVVEGSPAAKAGLVENDIIKAVNGQTVNSPDELVGAISGYGADESVELTYSRDGAPHAVSATLARRSDYLPYENIQIEMVEEEDDEVHADHHKEEPKRKLGVYLGNSEDGVAITNVSRNGIAEAAGLQAGDVITSFNGKEINSSDELVQAIQDAEAGTDVKVEYLRDGETQTRTVKFDF